MHDAPSSGHGVRPVVLQVSPAAAGVVPVVDVGRQRLGSGSFLPALRPGAVFLLTRQMLNVGLARQSRPCGLVSRTLCWRGRAEPLLGVQRCKKSELLGGTHRRSPLTSTSYSV